MIKFQWSRDKTFFTFTILSERKGIDQSQELGFDIFTVLLVQYNILIKTDCSRKNE